MNRSSATRFASRRVCCPPLRPRSLYYTWKGDEESDDVTDVSYVLEPIPDGTRFTWHHTGFTGLGGLAMSTLLGSVRRKMLDEGLPPALAAYHGTHAG